MGCKNIKGKLEGGGGGAGKKIAHT